ncbi:MAG TPA: membrane protein insertion efficiency factor YidD [Bacteroidia bacterium]|jgi:putative component of membrane protein insertase Oxa1/YidC/SpoIIIJ protein YidD
MKRRSWLVFILFVQLASAQNKNDLAFISSHTAGNVTMVSSLNTKTPIQLKRKNVVARYNPIALTFTGMMLLYQRVISPQISSDCVYSRSCSNFSKEAIHQFGLIKGIFLTADRLLRCNRSCENDFPLSSFEPNGKIKDEPSDYRK